MPSNSEIRYWRTLDPDLRKNVRELRHDPASCEQTFWLRAKANAIEGVKFRRQHPFEGFILDFYAPELGLAVEIDGDVHDEPGRKGYDRWREARLREHGLRTIRYTNAEIAVDIDGVTDRLRTVIRELH